MPPTAQSKAFRVTPQRAAVLEVVRNAKDHPNAREIYRRVKHRLPGIGFATVYRTLNLLVRHGEILELQFGDDPVARYDGDARHHDHVLCSVCRTVADIRVDLPGGIADRAEAASGFAIAGYELQFIGRCPVCREMPEP